jgi:tripartite-type tricarboxylate transporter receptor subunit TctC
MLNCKRCQLKSFNTVVRMVTVGVLMAIVGAAIAQQQYPNKPIRIIVPYAPGGAIDPLARLIGPKLTESWGQPVIVENHAGGNTIIGNEILIKSTPDGHTIILVGGNTHAINPHLILNLPYDPVKDFAAVATIISAPQLLVINPSVPANNLLELIALAKANPGQLNYGTPGSGTSTHLASEMFNMLAGVKIQHVPYKGGGPAIADLIGGRLQVYMSATTLAIPHIQSGKLRALATTGENRLPALPKVPTITEAGLPGFDFKVWYGMLAPAGTPKPIIEKLSAELARILRLPDIGEKLALQGMQPFISTPDQVAALITSELAKYGKIIKAANIKLED